MSQALSASDTKCSDTLCNARPMAVSPLGPLSGWTRLGTARQYQDPRVSVTYGGRDGRQQTGGSFGGPASLPGQGPLPGRSWAEPSRV